MQIAVSKFSSVYLVVVAFNISKFIRSNLITGGGDLAAGPL